MTRHLPNLALGPLGRSARCIAWWAAISLEAAGYCAQDAGAYLASRARTVARRVR